MAIASGKLVLTLAVGVLLAGLAALIAGAVPTAPPPHRRPPPSPEQLQDAADALAREQREVNYLRALRTQYHWGIDNLLVNQSFTMVEMERLKAQERLMPADDPERKSLERRLRALPGIYADFIEAEARVRELLGELEAELAAREAALARHPAPAD